MKKILSIDGGGIKGIIPGQVLIALETKLQQRTGNPAARLAEYFDFFAGTSTGGILTCIYLCPAADNPAKARFSAKEAVDIYVANGGAIFKVSLWKRIASQDGISDEKYDAGELQRLLNQYFGEIKLSQLLKPCFVSAYDIKNRTEFFFTQHEARRRGRSYDFLVKDVCRATSAAPTYFETALTKALDGVEYPLIDGGVFINNPALGAYSEVRNAGGSPKAEDMFIVSLGMGENNRSYEYDRARNWGSVEWVKPVIDIMMSGASATTNYHLTKIFSAVGKSNQYVRIQPPELGNVSPDIDNDSPENIRALVALGTETAQRYDGELNRIVDVLINGGNDPVIFA